MTNDNMKLRNIHKILFITLSNIGDCVLTLPVLSALEDNFKDASFDIVVGPRPKDVFIKDPNVRKIFTYDKHAALKAKVNFLQGLKRERYDLAVDMRGGLIPYIIGARYKTGLFFSNTSSSRHKRSAHLAKIKSLSIKYNLRRNIYIDKDDNLRVKTILEKEGVGGRDILIGVSPGTNSFTKQWRKEGFIGVVSKLLSEGEDHKIVLIGDAKEAGLCSEIGDSIKIRRVINLAGKINLNELFALIERCHVLLTGDTAALHIASDLGVKVVAIFGPTDPAEYGPGGQRDIVIRKNLACSPCKKALCRFNHECMTEITSEEVLEAVRSLLA